MLARFRTALWCGSVNYCERVDSGNSGLKHVDDFMRLFLAPGVAHCAGGVGPNPIGTLEAVADWVGNGIAPERVVASRTLPDGTVRTRPLCPYPTTAKWTGVGGSDDAANFVCVDGKQDPADFRITGLGSN
jgi:hypothetical protein